MEYKFRKVQKKEGKPINAFILGASSEKEKELIENGQITYKDGSYYLKSQETPKGALGEKAEKGDYFKIDSKGFPYPNKKDWFEKNHEHIKNDTYVQLPKPIMSWKPEYGENEVIKTLVENGQLILNNNDKNNYFNAKLWGEQLSSPKTSTLIIYSMNTDENGKPCDIDFNFVAEDEFEKTYDFTNRVIEQNLTKIEELVTYIDMASTYKSGYTSESKNINDCIKQIKNCLDDEYITEGEKVANEDILRAIDAIQKDNQWFMESSEFDVNPKDMAETVHSVKDNIKNIRQTMRLKEHFYEPGGKQSENNQRTEKRKTKDELSLSVDDLQALLVNEIKLGNIEIIYCEANDKHPYKKSEAGKVHRMLVPHKDIDLSKITDNPVKDKDSGNIITAGSRIDVTNIKEMQIYKRNIAEKVFDKTEAPNPSLEKAMSIMDVKIPDFRLHDENDVKELIAKNEHIESYDDVYNNLKSHATITIKDGFDKSIIDGYRELNSVVDYMKLKEDTEVTKEEEIISEKN